MALGDSVSSVATPVKHVRREPATLWAVSDPDTRVEMRRSDELSDAERANVIEVCVAAHESEEFRKLFTYFSGGDRHFLGYRGADLASHAVVSTRWLQPGGSDVVCTAYVDAVSTRPDMQRLGCSSAVMRRLAASIDDYDIACLQTDIPGFYERLGWELWRGPLAGRDGDRLIPTPEQRGVMVLRLARTSPTLDLDRPLSIEVQPDRIWE
jgi:aminoglycoside 2'-N-acetyltransferase I